MDNSSQSQLHLDPSLLEILFAFKRKVSSTFHDILGIHEIAHVSITQIKNNHLLILSSTPALEFNLFNSSLWRYDKAYQPAWFQLGQQEYWQNLYDPERYDELYYLKQIKHQYPLGINLASQNQQDYFIYSFASQKSCHHTRELFANQHQDFYSIGHYCFNQLSSVFNSCAAFSASSLS